MEILLGLIVWQSIMAVLGLLVHIWRKRALKEPAQATGLVLSAWALAVCAALGVVPILALANLFGPVELLLVLAPSLFVGSVLLAVLRDRPRFVAKPPADEHAV